MAIRVQAAFSSARGVDTIAPFTMATAAKFKNAGYDFVVRYLGAIQPQEREAILGAGLALLAVGYSRRPGWQPSAGEGLGDGNAAVTHAQEAGLLSGMTLFCDLEGPATSASAADCIAYVNAWAKPVAGAGFVAGLYVGYGIPLTPAQLYHDLAVTAYWHSLSNVPDVAVRGYQMVQQPPGNQLVLGVKVDVDVVQADKNGDTPMWMIDAPTSLV
jgi:hypothetical protein